MKKYVVQIKIQSFYVDLKEYKILDYAIKYCKKEESKFNYLKLRVIEVVYEEI